MKINPKYTHLSKEFSDKLWIAYKQFGGFEAFSSLHMELHNEIAPSNQSFYHVINGRIKKTKVIETLLEIVRRIKETDEKLAEQLKSAIQ